MSHRATPCRELRFRAAHVSKRALRQDAPSLTVAARILSAALALLAAAPAVALDGPVAVMPFKNLNEDPSLTWLSNGIAETMISDLRRSGKVTVVERSQVDSALAEMALQGIKGTEESTASRVGKMVGARVMVVGGYQEAGSQLRITARFVNVETSVILDAAKVTGPAEQVLSLQDDIVARLLGEDPKAARPAGRPKRKATPKTLQAYRLYAMSLSTASDAERVGYLKQSLDLDPEFIYAMDDLKALEKRMAGYSERSNRVLEERERATRAQLQQEGGTPEERAQKAFQLLTADMTSFRYKAMLADAARIYATDLPPYGTMNVKEYAAYSVFLAHLMLKHTDLALQAGEKYMKEFAGGLYFSSVEMQMDNLIRQRREEDEGKKEAETELQKIEGERSEAFADRRPPHPVRLRGLDFQRCSAMQRTHQYERVLTECQAFVDKHRSDTDAGAEELVLIARWQMVNALAAMGRFDDARRAGQALIEEKPEFARRMSIKVVISTWPRD